MSKNTSFTSSQSIQTLTKRHTLSLAEGIGVGIVAVAGFALIFFAAFWVVFWAQKRRSQEPRDSWILGAQVRQSAGDENAV
jgi:hypothetical protein